MQAIPLHQSFIKLLFLGGILAGFFSCKTYSEDDKHSFDEKIEQFIRSKKWKMNRSQSGLYSEVITEGTGEKIQYSSEVSILYKGTLLNGKIVDQTPSGEPLDSPLRELIHGFQEALLDQKEGVKLRVVIPPNLGYGDQELEKIPPHSILSFEIEVVEVN